MCAHSQEGKKRDKEMGVDRGEREMLVARRRPPGDRRDPREDLRGGDEDHTWRTER